jgi:hypothetical protein
MGILIPRQLTIEQYVKLFSNPVSGIACEVDAYNRDHRVNYHCQNIRYSKSMILNALYFWEKQYNEFYRRLKRASFNPIFNLNFEGNDGILDKIMLIHNLPDSFLFSHRYIKMNCKKYSKQMNTQLQLLKNKYPLLEQKCTSFGFSNTLQPCYNLKISYGIEFTVFPNEHPYIPKQKITKVGMTDRGNVYVLHKKDGAYTPTTTKDKKTVQAPKLWNNDIPQPAIPEGKLSRMLRELFEAQSKWRIEEDE